MLSDCGRKKLASLLWRSKRAQLTLEKVLRHYVPRAAYRLAASRKFCRSARTSGGDQSQQFSKLSFSVLLDAYYRSLVCFDLCKEEASFHGKPEPACAIPPGWQNNREVHSIISKVVRIDTLNARTPDKLEGTIWVLRHTKNTEKDRIQINVGKTGVARTNI